MLVALLTALLIPAHRHASLLAWDGYWYETIAVHGYAASPAGAIRFFPVLPLLARWSAALVLAPPGVMLVVIGNAAALLYLFLARRVALAAGLGNPAADLSTAAVALAPAGFVLAMGYTEALFGVLVCVVLLGARRGRWWACAAAALVAGALRPTGVLLCLPTAIEAARGLRAATPGGLVARLAATCAPAAGLVAYLGWAWHAYGDPLTPFRVQTAADLRGGVLVNPFTSLVRAVETPWPALIRVVWILVALALLVVSARRLPVSFTVFAAATVFLAVTARNFGSFERYACSALPLLLAAAAVLAERPRLRLVAAIAAPLILFGQSLLSFTSSYVP
ncbi:hypothetical protein [Actinoplanes subtropicus]|uniref:hypothetical protein n=1 Tax=Actinoplanes subtropicus TaxID=543632 RepID=UPI0012FB5BBA|nr:hypothetical protein [Actinoplanes subtropicus]